MDDSRSFLIDFFWLMVISLIFVIDVTTAESMLCLVAPCYYCARIADGSEVRSSIVPYFQRIVKNLKTD